MRIFQLFSATAFLVACGQSGASGGSADGGSAAPGGTAGVGGAAIGGHTGGTDAATETGGTAGAAGAAGGASGAAGAAATDAGPCGPTCAGCCQDGACLSGTSDSACGVKNQACVSCGPGSACRFAGTQFECVVLKKDGEPCTMAYECEGSVCDVFDFKCKSNCAGMYDYCGSTPCCVAQASCVVPPNDFFGHCCIPKGAATPSCSFCCDPSAGCQVSPSGAICN
jgi:hypothetical protein